MKVLHSDVTPPLLLLCMSKGKGGDCLVGIGIGEPKFSLRRKNSRKTSFQPLHVYL